MKVRPVRKTAPAPIPTAAEAAADPSLVVAPAPAARARRGMGAMVGAGLLGSLLSPAVGAANGLDSHIPATAPTTARAVPDPADAEVAARAEAEREAVATVVAPILQRALDEEGRGFFGCIAIDPPMVLSETEALDLIKQEFARAGVALREKCEISGFARTVPEQTEGDNPDPHTHPAGTFPGSWVFDLATEDGSVAVEFLSRQDADRENSGGNVSTAEVCDLSALAQRLGHDFATRTDGPALTVGLFFDPLVSVTVWDEKQQTHVPRTDSVFAAFSEEELEELSPYHGEQGSLRNALLRRDARELLREQVHHFLDWARKEGKLH